MMGGGWSVVVDCTTMANVSRNVTGMTQILYAPVLHEYMYRHDTDPLCTLQA